MTRQTKRRSMLWTLFLTILAGGLNAQGNAVNPLWETAVECIMCLAYQVGPYRLLGYGKMPKSTLVRKQESGNRDIYADFVKYCPYKGKKIPFIERRRKEEYERLFVP